MRLIEQQSSHVTFGCFSIGLLYLIMAWPVALSWCNDNKSSLLSFSQRSWDIWDRVRAQLFGYLELGTCENCRVNCLDIWGRAGHTQKLSRQLFGYLGQSWAHAKTVASTVWISGAELGTRNNCRVNCLDIWDR